MRISDLHAAGAIAIQNGFPCGNWNDDGVGIAQIRPFNVSDGGRIDLRVTKFIETDQKLAPYLLRLNDVVFNNTNSEELVGKTALWTQSIRAVLSNHMTIVRVLDQNAANPRFLALYLLHKWYEGHFRMVCRRHVNQASVSRERLSEIPFPSIPADEQRQIARLLSAVQRAIERQERLIALTAELKKALMHKLFTEGTRGEPLNQTEIGPVPESWTLSRLGDHACKVSKGSSPKWQGFQYVSEGVLFVRSQNVGAGALDFSDRVFVPPSFNQKEKRSILQEGDILINLVGASIGRVCLASSELTGANCNQAVGFVRVDTDECFKLFWVNFLLSPAGQRQIFQHQKDIARANLSLLDIRSLLVPVPPSDEAEWIAAIFSRVQQKEDLATRDRSTLQALFRTLLHQLMTAQIRVHDLDLSALDERGAEPAEVA